MKLLEAFLSVRKAVFTTVDVLWSNPVPLKYHGGSRKQLKLMWTFSKLVQTYKTALTTVDVL